MENLQIVYLNILFQCHSTLCYWASPWSVQLYLSSNAIEPLDWAHITLRATGLQAGPAGVLGLTSIPWTWVCGTATQASTRGWTTKTTPNTSEPWSHKSATTKSSRSHFHGFVDVNYWRNNFSSPIRNVQLVATIWMSPRHSVCMWCHHSLLPQPPVLDMNWCNQNGPWITIHDDHWWQPWYELCNQNTHVSHHQTK
jgi:hypothetical protein